MKLLATPKRNPLATFVYGALGAYVLLGGAGSCPPCGFIGTVPSLVGTAQAEDAQGGVPEKMPAWSLKDLDGKTVSSSSLSGKVLFIDFWATWCPPCREMIPDLIKVQDAYKDKGLQVVGISLDEGGPAKVKPFAEKAGVNYVTVMGDEATVEAFGGVQGIPTSFIVDRDGNIVSRHVGMMSREEIEKAIAPLFE